MSFKNPCWLLLALPLAFAAWRLLRTGRRAGIRFSALGRLPRRTSGWRAFVASLTPYILLAGLASLVVAAARPRSPLAHEKRNVNAIAIAMTVDVSGSMNALDLAPPGELESARDASKLRGMTRLAVVKELFREFVEHRPDDLIGLVSFGTYAATVSPLTAYHEGLLQELKALEIPEMAFDDQNRPIGGEYEANTAIGDGLAFALERLKSVDLKTKIVILLSDGENNTGAVEPDEAAAVAAKMGVKVYTIGIGTKRFAIPMLAKDRYGRDAVVRAREAFDERQLKGIAAKTGGTYYSVTDRDSLEKALEEIDKLEKTELEVDTWDRWEEHFSLFLLLGALLVFAAVSLSMASARRMA